MEGFVECHGGDPSHHDVPEFQVKIDQPLAFVLGWVVLGRVGDARPDQLLVDSIRTSGDTVGHRGKDLGVGP